MFRPNIVLVLVCCACKTSVLWSSFSPRFSRSLSVLQIVSSYIVRCFPARYAAQGYGLRLPLHNQPLFLLHPLLPPLFISRLITNSRVSTTQTRARVRTPLHRARGGAVCSSFVRLAALSRCQAGFQREHYNGILHHPPRSIVFSPPKFGALRRGMGM